MKDLEIIYSDKWIVTYDDDVRDKGDHIPEYDDGEWDPVMGNIDDYPETDDEWLDDFQGEEDWT